MTDSLRKPLEDHTPVERFPILTLDAPISATPLSSGLLLLIFLVATGMLYGLGVAVLSGDSMQFDSTVLLALHRYAYHHLDRFATFISMLVTTASVLVLVYLCYRRRWQHALFWLGSTAGAALLAGIAKKVVQRHRPELWEFASHHASFSFPSGHATQSMAFVIALLLLAPPAKRKIIFLLGTAWIFLVGICRLYLGMHYPTDVFAGWALALAWGCLLGLLFRFPRTASH